jgi:hypothetical protein
VGLRINTNIPALTALRKLQFANADLTRSMQRLSTGLRINTASDDPSGLVVSEQLRAQIRSLAQASDNAANASSLLQTGEAALSEISTLLVQLRESGIYAMNTGGASAEQIAAEQNSVDQVLEAIDRIASTTRFATRNLFNGTSGFDIVQRPAEITDLNPISVNFDPGHDHLLAAGEPARAPRESCRGRRGRTRDLGRPGGDPRHRTARLRGHHDPGRRGHRPGRHRAQHLSRQHRHLRRHRGGDDRERGLR